MAQDPRRPALIGCVLALAAAACAAGGLQISPVGLSLPPDQPAGGVWLSNAGEGSLQAQVRVYRWTQQDDEDRLVPSQELVVSPPMLQIAQGGSQLVRTLRLGPAPAGPGAVELAYRVVFDELPQKPPPGRTLSFVMRYSIPVFLTPAKPAANAPAPRLDWRLRRSEGQVQLEVANAGDAHAQLADIDFVDASGQRTSLHAGLLGYVLPASRMRWRLKAAPDTASGGTIEALVNGEKKRQALALVDALP